MPCPYGVNIPGNFTYYNNCVNEGTIPPADENAADYAVKKAAFIKGYKAQVSAEELATKCVACGECLSKCPQRIRIPDRMGKLAQMFDEE